MKFLIVIDYVGSGGAQGQKIYLAKGLHNSGHTVNIFSYYST